MSKITFPVTVTPTIKRAAPEPEPVQELVKRVEPVKEKSKNEK